MDRLPLLIWVIAAGLIWRIIMHFVERPEIETWSQMGLGSRRVSYSSASHVVNGSLDFY